MKLLRLESTKAASPADVEILSTVLLKLESFANLERGWRLGAGVPVPANVISIGKRIAVEFHRYGFPQMDVFPGADEDILVTAYWDDNYVSVLVNASGLLTLNYEKGDRPITFAEHLRFDEMIENLRRISSQIWNTSESSSRAISIISKAGSTTWLSRRTAVVSPVLSPNAPSRVMAAFVST